MANQKERKEVRRTEEGLYICDRCGEYFEEQDMSRGRYGVIGLCKKCVGEAHRQGAYNRKKNNDNLKQEVEQLRIECAELKRQLREKAESKLAVCTPRDLMAELYRRGYKGELEYVKVTKVDISKMED